MSEEEKPKTTTAESETIEPKADARTRRRHPRFVAEVVSELKAEFSFSGPLPPPSMLAAYKNAFPDCPQRIVAMAERQSQHRQDMERAHFNGVLSLRKRGQTIGAVLATLALLGGVFLLYQDKSLAGYSVLLGDAALFGAAFFYDRIFKRESDDEDDDEKDENGGANSNLPAPQEKGVS